MKILTIVGVSVNTLPHLKNNSLPPPFPTPQILGNPPFLKFREPPPPLPPLSISLQNFKGTL